MSLSNWFDSLPRGQQLIVANNGKMDNLLTANKFLKQRIDQIIKHNETEIIKYPWRHMHNGTRTENILKINISDAILPTSVAREIIVAEGEKTFIKKYHGGKMQKTVLTTAKRLCDIDIIFRDGDGADNANKIDT